MREAIEADSRGEPRGGKHGEHGLSGAVGANSPSPAEDTLLIFRQRLKVITAGGEP
jgi:hypothetical protein